MSPERPASRSSCTSSKPYVRNLSFATPSLQDPKDIAQPKSPHTHGTQDSEGKPGFPTRAQYQLIERGYIQSLTPRRQGKALISQALFDRIWDVLHSKDSSKENAQFRFWARKMFTLSKSHTLSLGPGDPRPVDREVLLHDGLLVAVREQIYDLLCFCHGSTNHGGRDKTCALIRKHYTWVPKDLVAQFIKACPSCIMKKCGHSDIGLLSPHSRSCSVSPVVPTPSKVSVEEKIDSGSTAFSDYFNEFDGQEGQGQDAYSLPSTPIGTSHPQFVLSSDHLIGTPVDQLRRYNQLSSNSPSDRLSGFPMTREVSLYKGLPDGWQYQGISYRNAHAECAEYQRVAQIMPYDPSLGRTRPRIPNLAPLFRSDLEDILNIKAEDADELMVGRDGLGFGHTLSFGSGGFNLQSMSPELGYPTEDSPIGRHSVGPIDPLLLAFSNAMQTSNEGSPVPTRVALGTILNDNEVHPSHCTENSMNCNNSIPRLKLEDLDSVRTLQDYISIRENLNPEFVAPTGGGSDFGSGFLWGSKRGSGSGIVSPTSSTKSAASGLSLMALAGSGNFTPNTTAPVTPADEESLAKAGLMDMHVS